MGAQASEPGDQNYDPDARPGEHPPHAVTLDPFFLSKYEMTQSLWRRSMETNPSRYPPESRPRGVIVTLHHPIEQVTWENGMKVARRLALILPSEAQWEYACRGGTDTPFHTGSKAATLLGYANIAGEGSVGWLAPGWAFEPGFDDGYGAHAPVGSFKPNGFGFHDMHGNVREWCAGGEYSYAAAQHRSGDGLVIVAAMRTHPVRGGGFNRFGAYARAVARNHLATRSRSGDLGLRLARLVEGHLHN
jgi:formylglycine-generating enzyme required for sulfatase activity